MKKLAIFLLLLLTVNAAQQTPREVLLQTIVHALVAKEKPSIYIDDTAWREKIKKLEDVAIVKVCSNADLVLTQRPEKMIEICPNALLFITAYRTYRTTPQAVGALFWQKGRPTLLFNRRALQKHAISLPASLRQYEE